MKDRYDGKAVQRLTMAEVCFGQAAFNRGPELAWQSPEVIMASH